MCFSHSGFLHGDHGLWTEVGWDREHPFVFLQLSFIAVVSVAEFMRRMPRSALGHKSAFVFSGVNAQEIVKLMIFFVLQVRDH